jgi:hypothetical protein
MIEVRPATSDEMVLAFLRAEIDSPSERGNLFTGALTRISADRSLLIDRGDVTYAQQNAARRSVLGMVRGYGRNEWLFRGFPDHTGWRLVKATPDEIRGFKYVNHQEGWARISGNSRLVADGTKNLDDAQNADIMRNVSGIAARLRRGDRFPALIAVQCIGRTDLVLVEGHTRATAYALTGMPNDIDVLIGTSPHMNLWVFF